MLKYENKTNVSSNYYWDDCAFQTWVWQKKYQIKKLKLSMIVKMVKYSKHVSNKIDDMSLTIIAFCNCS